MSRAAFSHHSLAQSITQRSDPREIAHGRTPARRSACGALTLCNGLEPFAEAGHGRPYDPYESQTESKRPPRAEPSAQSTFSTWVVVVDPEARSDVDQPTSTRARMGMQRTTPRAANACSTSRDSQRP